MDSVYITHTPYHLLIACGYARKYDDTNEKRLVIISDFANAERYFDAISHWDSCPFTTIDLLPGRYSLRKGILSQTLLQRANRIQLQRYFNEKVTTGCIAYIFNDANIEGQVVALENKRLGGFNIYVEDGFAAYGYDRLPHLDKIHHLLAKLIYGDWYQNVEILGQSAYIDRVLVFYPSDIRSELKSAKVSQLPKDILVDLDLGLRSKILTNLNTEIAGHRNDVLIILPHSSYAKKHNIQNIKNTYLDIIKEFKKLRYSIGVKYHPRETEYNYLDLDSTPGIEILPQDIPIEIQFLIYGIPPKFVIGDTSTGLLTARIILGEKAVILSIHNIIRPEDQIPNIFQTAGIIQPRSIVDLKRYILHIK